MLRRLIIILAAVLGAVASAQEAQEAQPFQAVQNVPRITPDKIEEVDAFVESRLAELGLPGAAVALIQDGEIVHAKGYGVTETGGDPVTPDTVFQIGSVSKSFAATGVLLLVADGQLSLDDPVVKHLHRFRTHRPFRSDQITIRHALTHRSGISTFDGNRTHTLFDTSATAQTRAMRGLSSIRLQSDPGERYAYSNANYLILGAVIERVSGQPYEAFVQERILDPLGLQNTSAGIMPVDGTAQAVPHRLWFGQPSPYDAPETRVDEAYGGVWSTANDLANYVISFGDDARALLSADARAEMFKNASEAPIEENPGYGFGWFLEESDTHRWIYHTGANVGFSSIAGFSPDAGFGVVVLQNGQALFSAKQTHSLAAGVVDLVRGQPPMPVDAPLLIRILRFVLMTLPFVFAAWIAFTAWKRRYWGFTPMAELTLREMAVQLALPSFILFGLSYILYILVPQLNGASMSAIHLFTPDLGVLLTASAVMAFLAGTARLGLRFWPQQR